MLDTDLLQGSDLDKAFASLVDMSDRGPVDHKAEEFGAAIVATRVHHLFSSVDQREVEIGNHYALSRAQGLPD